MDWDTTLRWLAAACWVVFTARIIRHQGLIDNEMMILFVSASLTLLLVVIAAGPVLVGILGAGTIRTMYTATATIIFLVGLAFVSSRIR